MALRDMRAWEYTDNNGDVWNVGVPLAYTTQLDGGSNPKIGGQAATVKRPPPDPRLKLRHVSASAADGSVRTIVVMEDDAALFAKGATIDLFQGGGGTAVTYTVDKLFGEIDTRRLRKLGV